MAKYSLDELKNMSLQDITSLQDSDFDEFEDRDFIELLSVYLSKFPKKEAIKLFKEYSLYYLGPDSYENFLKSLGECSKETQDRLNSYIDELMYEELKDIDKEFPILSTFDKEKKNIEYIKLNDEKQKTDNPFPYRKGGRVEKALSNGNLLINDFLKFKNNDRNSIPSGEATTPPISSEKKSNGDKKLPYRKGGRVERALLDGTYRKLYGYRKGGRIEKSLIDGTLSIEDYLKLKKELEYRSEVIRAEKQKTDIPNDGNEKSTPPGQDTKAGNKNDRTRTTTPPGQDTKADNKNDRTRTTTPPGQDTKAGNKNDRTRTTTPPSYNNVSAIPDNVHIYNNNNNYYYSTPTVNTNYPVPKKRFILFRKMWNWMKKVSLKTYAHFKEIINKPTIEVKTKKYKTPQLDVPYTGRESYFPDNTSSSAPKIISAPTPTPTPTPAPAPTLEPIKLSKPAPGLYIDSKTHNKYCITPEGKQIILARNIDFTDPNIQAAYKRPETHTGNSNPGRPETHPRNPRHAKSTDEMDR